MGNEAENLRLEILHCIQNDISDLKTNLQTGLAGINIRIAAIESHMAGIHTLIASNSNELNALRQCVGRIERRLDLIDS